MIIDLRDDVAKHYPPNYILQQSIVTTYMFDTTTNDS